ncbi:hypothetical protein MKX03_023535 [Papaver bracteatum]|nr:hypothetical protein MKX03_023535 [Papaver bracteatum]
MARGKEAGNTQELCAKYFTLADSSQEFYSLLVSDSYRWNGEATPVNLTPSANADMNGGVGKGNYLAGCVADIGLPFTVDNTASPSSGKLWALQKELLPCGHFP